MISRAEMFLLGRGVEQESRQGFVLELTESKNPSPRVVGMQEVKSCGLRIPEAMFILGHNAFKEWQRGGMTKNLKNQILTAFRKIRQENPGRGAYIGRAFFVPGIENPAGLRTAAIYDEQTYLTEVESFLKDVILREYDVPGADLALVFHPFIHAAEPLKFKEPPLEWPGGDLVPLLEGKGVFIRATFGPDESVQGFDRDEYIVRDYRVGKKVATLIEKKVATKTETLFPRLGKTYEYEKWPIPKEFQNLQALNNSQILELFEAYEKIQQRFGPRRLEFIVQPEGIIFRECLPWNVTAEALFPLDQGEIVGSVVRITSEVDIKRVVGPAAVTFFPPEVFQRRDINLFALLASHAKKEGINLVNLSHGTIATAHLVRIFTDLKQSVVFVGDDDYADGEKVRVFKENGRPQVERLEATAKFLVDLGEIKKARQAEIGGKGRNLAELKEAGITVPTGFCFSTEAFSQQLERLGLDHLVAKLDLLEGEDLHKALAQIREIIAKSSLSPTLEKTLREKLMGYKSRSLAVRSSANHEDEIAAFAGLFATYLRIPKWQVSQRISKVWASVFTESVIKYAKSLGIPSSDLRMGVVIQEMLKAEKGGVIFTGDHLGLPYLTISAAKGGEAVEKIVGGRAKNRHQLVIEPDRTTKKIKKVISEERLKGRILTPSEIRKLTRLALRIETIFGGKPQDIEWLIQEDGRVVILQSRPLPLRQQS